MRAIRYWIILILLSAGGVGAVALGQDQQPSPQQPPASDRRHGEGRWQFPGIVGTITAIHEDNFILKTAEGQMVAVTLNDKTRFRKEGADAKASDFKVGDQVAVRGQQTGHDAWLAQAVLSHSGSPNGFREGLGKEFIAGEIKSIDGTKLTIQRPDGETQVITVDENTSFRKENESITLADLKPGDHVYGRGQMKDGVFVPAALNVGELRSRRGGGPPREKPPSR